MTDLGVLPGAPTADFYSVPALNERGQVAGQSPTASGEYHAVLWTDLRRYHRVHGGDGSGSR